MAITLIASVCLASACSDAGVAQSGDETGAPPTYETTGSEQPAPAMTATPAASPAAPPTTTGAVPPATPPAAPATPPATPPTTPPTTPPVTPPDPSTPGTGTTGPVPYRGINLAGAEFGSALPGKDGTDYGFPTPSEIDYYMSKGMNTFRVAFKWERLQSSAYSAFDSAYFGKLDAVVKYATAKNATVILEPHNFARYYGNTVGSSQVPNAVFADLWSRLGAAYASNPSVMFNLVNEPHDLPTMQWVGAANAAIAGARTAGANNVVVVPGNAWTGAHSWNDTTGGASNAVALLSIVDSANNVVFEAHQYLDGDSGGGSDQCVSKTIGSERMVPFVSWLRAHGKKGMLGEFAGGNNATCNAAVTDLLDYMMKQTDVLVGWLWWAGGPRWGNYQFTLDPQGGKDRPQMALLTPFLGK